MSSRGAVASESEGLPRSARAELILREAARLFTERGYQSTTINHIGEAAGISGPGVYRHFESKQDILMALIQRGAEGFAQRATALLGEPGIPKNELLRQLVHLNVDWILLHRQLAAAYWGELYNLDPKARRRLASLEEGYRELWRAALRQLRPELSAEEADEISDGIYWLMRSTAFYDGHVKGERFSNLVTRMALGAITADQREPRLPSTRGRGPQRDRMVQQPTPGAP
jgi:AcrR family transcriptional regulator